MDASPGQESQLLHVLIYQQQLLLSLTAAAADPIPPKPLLFYSYIIFFFMFFHVPAVAPDGVCVPFSFHVSQSRANFLC